METSEIKANRRAKFLAKMGKNFLFYNILLYLFI